MKVKHEVQVCTDETWYHLTPAEPADKAQAIFDQMRGLFPTATMRLVRIEEVVTVLDHSRLAKEGSGK